MALPKPATIDPAQIWLYKSSIHGDNYYDIVSVANGTCHTSRPHAHLAPNTAFGSGGPKKYEAISNFVNNKWEFMGISPNIATPTNGTSSPTANPVPVQIPTRQTPQVQLPPPPRKKTYYVSMNNRDWVRYELLGDSDPIEKYPYYKEV